MPTLILLVLGVLLLALLGYRLFAAVRGFSLVRKRFSRHLEHSVGTLRARAAALRQAIDERRRGAAEVPPTATARIE